MLRRLRSSLNIVGAKPKPRRTELDASDLLKGFKHVSNYLQPRHPERIFRIVVSGGTCSVLLLRNRTSTRGIGFFIPDAEAMNAILDSKRAAPDFIQDSWPPNWINAEMIAYVLNYPGCEDFYETSISKNVIIYESAALIAYAADWRYQLVGKIAMMMLQDEYISHQRRRKDLGDAVSILRQLVVENAGQPLVKDVIKTWYGFGSALEDEGIECVNVEYVVQFGSDGIV